MTPRETLAALVELAKRFHMDLGMRLTVVLLIESDKVKGLP